MPQAQLHGQGWRLLSIARSIMRIMDTKLSREMSILSRAEARRAEGYPRAGFAFPGYDGSGGQIVSVNVRIGLPAFLRPEHSKQLSYL